MVGTKLVPKRVRIRQWPPKEPYVKFKIKTLLPEQKVVQIRKNGQVIRTVTVRRKKKRIYRSVGQNLFQKMLAANWSDHDAKINPIINYFADRQHTGKIIRDIENFVSRSCHYCKICLKCQKLHTYIKENSIKWDFGHLTKMLNTGTFTIKIGATETKYLN